MVRIHVGQPFSVFSWSGAKTPSADAYRPHRQPALTDSSDTTARHTFFASFRVRQSLFSTALSFMAVQAIESPASVFVSWRVQEKVMPPTTARCSCCPTILNCIGRKCRPRVGPQVIVWAYAFNGDSWTTNQRFKQETMKAATEGGA